MKNLGKMFAFSAMIGMSLFMVSCSKDDATAVAEKVAGGGRQ
ncbi:MAG: hypothetical protein ACKOX7_08945 [Bacteroidota bacterium]